MTGHLVMATICRTHAVKPPVIPRVGVGLKWRVSHGASAMVGEVQARGGAAPLLTPRHLLTILIAIPILT